MPKSGIPQERVDGNSEAALLAAALRRKNAEADARLLAIKAGLESGGATQVREAVIAAEGGIIQLSLVRTIVLRRIQGAISMVREPRDERERQLVEAWRLAVQGLTQNQQVSVPFALPGGGVDVVTLPAAV